MPDTTTLAIIGGTGFAPPPGLAIKTLRENTPWGEPSGGILEARHGSTRVLFLQRHGAAGNIAPHAVNYRANIHALWRLGARRIIAINVVGGISEQMQAGCIVIPEQLIDYTSGRAHTFHDASSGTLHHADFSAPYCQTLRETLRQAAEQARLPAIFAGTYGVSQGPRLETSAEIQRMERDGCDIVGMTGMPEAALARERDCAYACLALVVNRASGKTTETLDLQRIRANIDLGMTRINRLLEQLLAEA